MASFASSSRTFLLPRIAPSSSKRAFSHSAAALAPYRTSTGQEAVLPTHVSKYPKGVNSQHPQFDFVEYRDRQQIAYPFSSSVVVPFIPPLPKPVSNQRPPRGTSVMEHVDNTLRMTGDPSSFYHLFAKRNPDRIMPGAVVSVQTYTSAAKTQTSTFTGVVIAITRKSVATSFIVRNVVLRTGVEMRYFCSSPLVKDIRLVRNATGKDGDLPRTKRNKLYYYRDQPHRITNVVNALKDSKRMTKNSSGTAFL